MEHGAAPMRRLGLNICLFWFFSDGDTTSRWLALSLLVSMIGAAVTVLLRLQVLLRLPQADTDSDSPAVSQGQVPLISCLTLDDSGVRT